MQKFDLESIPRISHCILPTPIIPLERLSESLGKARIFVKRDDLTGIAFGGNKNRKLEFLLADALLKGSDVIITEGAITSNHCLQTVACAARLGLECELVLSDSKIDEKMTGNLLLDQILDAKIHLVKTNAERKKKMNKIAEELKANGRQPYVIPTGGSNKIGILGYVLCINEIMKQSTESGITFDYFVHATGSAGTQAGSLIGAKLYYPDLKVIGISVGDKKKEIIAEVAAIINDFQQEWNLSLAIDKSEIIVLDKYYGKGYGIPTKELIDTLKIVAKLEGIFLDPVYNGKAMIGLIDLIKTEEIPSDSNVLFLHSGGNVAIFNYIDFFKKSL